MSKTAVVLNAAAGRAADQLDALDHLARRHQCSLCIPRTPADLAPLVRSLASAGSQRLIVAGGDGTVARVVNALGPRISDIELALLPLGTGNDLARSLDLQADDMEIAFDLAVTRPATPIDLVQVQHAGRAYCVNAATGGFGGEVTAALRTVDKQLWGPFSYWLSAMSRLTDLHAFEVDVVVDGDAAHLRVYGIVIANGQYVGGGFPIARGAFVNDGLLDIVVVPELPALELLSVGLNFVLGRLAETENVVTKRARRIEVLARPTMPFSLDGEATEAYDAVFEVAPGALRFVTGDSPRGLLPPAESG